MAILRLPLVVVFLALALSLMACSKSDNNAPTAKALFNGCAVSSQLDDYTGSGSATPKALFSNGNSLWAVGSVKGASGPQQGLIRLSHDGKNWTDVNLSSGPQGQDVINNSIATDSSNTNIYVAQTYKTVSSTTSANIHYSNDGGQTWNNVPFQFKSQANETLNSVVLAPWGNPYFIGNSDKTAFIITLNKDKLGKDVPIPVLVRSLENAEYHQIAVTSPSSLSVVGAVLGDKGMKTWLLENGAEEGKNWEKPKDDPSKDTPPDNFPSNLDDATQKIFGKLFYETASTLTSILVSKANLSILSGAANAVMEASDGTIYEAGSVSTKLDVSASASNDRTAWIVRKRVNGAKDFTISDSFRDPQFESSVPVSLFDFDGHPVAVGVSRDGKSSSHWHIRIAMDRNSRWQTLGSAKAAENIAVTDEDSGRPVGAAAIGVGDNRSLVIIGDTVDNTNGTHHHWRAQQIGSCVRPH